MKSMFMLGNVRVLPVVPADAPAMVDVMDSAFAPTFHYQQMYPYGDVPEEDRSKRIELMQKTIESDEHAKLFKAVLIDDEGGDAFVNGVEVAVECEVNGKRSNGVESEKRKYKDAKDITLLPEKIVGWAKWRMYYEERPVEDLTEKKMEKEIEGMNVEYANWFWGTMDGNRRKLFGGMPLAKLAILVVRPQYQRKGVGSTLLQWGILEAKRANLPLFLESSIQGYELYARNGFKKLSDLGIRLEDFGVINMNEIILMIRPPDGADNFDASDWMMSLRRRRESLSSA